MVSQISSFVKPMNYIEQKLGILFCGWMVHSSFFTLIPWGFAQNQMQLHSG